MFSIASLNQQFTAVIQEKINLKTKPLGALGQLETCAHQLVTLFSQHLQSKQQFEAFRPEITAPTLIVFAADHGVASQGVSIAPSCVTAQMVTNFTAGGAAINIFCKQLGWQLEIVDAGMLNPVNHGVVHQQRLGAGTAAINLAMAMSREQVLQGLQYAKMRVQQIQQTGCNTLALGEMGIGNTTSAAAIMAAILKLPAVQCVGKGTGVSQEVVQQKVLVVEQALKLHHDKLDDPINLLAALGGFEIVQITGAILAAAEQGMAVLIDGFICSAAAMVATQIDSRVKDYLIFAHCSNEQGHTRMLEKLAVKPLLTLDMRLGEGTGAALALPLLQASLAFYNDMASFADAAVEQVV